MVLKDIDLKKSYNSDSDDILNQFYIPALSHAVVYKRMTGFFSSTSLALAARGVFTFLNQGNMNLLCGVPLQKVDQEAIKKGEELQPIIEKIMINALELMEDEFITDHVRALAWMMAHNTLKIKVVIPTDEHGLPAEQRQIESAAMFHQKIGILQDEHGDTISFSGCCSESVLWQTHTEEFKVFRSWNPYEEDYTQADVQKFEKFWNNTLDKAVTCDIPEAVCEKFMQMSPETVEELKEKWTHEGTKIHLWNHQRQAVAAWLTAEKGIFEMATGTGKTFTALGCLKEILKREKRLVTVIACPYDHLVKQWLDSIERFSIAAETVIADSSNPGWKDQLADHLYDIKNGITDTLVVLTTHATFSTETFQSIIKIVNEKVFLIADEVHGVGAPKWKKGLVPDYSFRLGLSATPRRWFDPQGTAHLFAYFGDTIFEFPLKKAIKTMNPATGKTYLTPYVYEPYFVSLTDDELEEYERETRRIAQAYYQAEEGEPDELYTLLLMKRQKIVKNAQRKYEAFKEILDSIPVNHCLVYCSPQQIGEVQKILNEKNIIQHEFTMNEGTVPQKEYNGLSEREFLLKKFAEGVYDVLVAMKCLDEGVDVPPARTAVILASSGNPRQYIQRRGRVLRHYPGKKKATIYDIIVEPLLKVREPDLVTLEKRVFEKELKRYKEFAFDALNALECLKKIERMEEKCRW